MNCCPNCFTDEFLKSHIEALADQYGKCDFCSNKDKPLINPSKLFDRFEPLLSLYKEDKFGESLIDLIESDWFVFNRSLGDKLEGLLGCITDNPDICKSIFIPVHKKESKSLDQWTQFRDELKHNNRFFPQNAPTIKSLEPFGKYLGIIKRKNDGVLYRARGHESNTPLPISKMGKPPAKKAIGGRANPVGIPYLYVATSVHTAISEIRGHKGELITVASFIVNEDLELVDLRNPQRTISPFELNEDDELEHLYRNMPYLVLLGMELSKPVLPREALLEYLPSQYLCEVFKQMGFHGIQYQSSVSDGTNYVIFQDDYLLPQDVSSYLITGTSTEYLLNK